MTKTRIVTLKTAIKLGFDLPEFLRFLNDFDDRLGNNSLNTNVLVSIDNETGAEMEYYDLCSFSCPNCHEKTADAFAQTSDADSVHCPSCNTYFDTEDFQLDSRDDLKHHIR